MAKIIQLTCLIIISNCTYSMHVRPNNLKINLQRFVNSRSLYGTKTFNNKVIRNFHSDQWKKVSREIRNNLLDENKENDWRTLANYKDQDDYYILMWVIKNKDYHMAKLLIAKGAKTNILGRVTHNKYSEPIDYARNILKELKDESFSQQEFQTSKENLEKIITAIRKNNLTNNLLILTLIGVALGICNAD